MLTADTITEEQIRRARLLGWIDESLLRSAIPDASNAFAGEIGIVAARTRCAEIWNIRTAATIDVATIRYEAECEQAEQPIDLVDDSFPTKVVALCDAYEKQRELLKTALVKLGDDTANRHYWEQFIRGEAGLP